MTADNGENVDNQHPHSDDAEDEIVSVLLVALRELCIYHIATQTYFLFSQGQTTLNSAELEAILHQLNKDGQMEALLSRERMRAERHRTNYVKIKEELVKLIHENRILTSEIGRIDGACKVARSTALSVKQQSSTELCKKNEELKMLEMQVPSTAELLDMENKESDGNLSEFFGIDKEQHDAELNSGP